MNYIPCVNKDFQDCMLLLVFVVAFAFVSSKDQSVHLVLFINRPIIKHLPRKIRHLQPVDLRSLLLIVCMEMWSDCYFENKQWTYNKSFSALCWMESITITLVMIIILAACTVITNLMMKQYREFIKQTRKVIYFSLKLGSKVFTQNLSHLWKHVFLNS